MKVDLTDGGWAEIRDDIERVSNRERRQVLLAYDNPEFTVYRSNLALADELIVVLVLSWSLSIPVPRDNRESLEDMTAHDYDLLSKAVLDQQPRLYANFEPDPDPESPTTPSEP